MADTTAHHDAHTHPGPAKYIQIAVVLFVLTALEVLAYEIGAGKVMPGMQATIEPIVVEILLILSAIKFALVAMFYMHLKQDDRLLSGIFIFPIFLALAIAAALIALFSVVFMLVK
jgi:caa(3)-type oxidase subunit IV